MTPRTHFVSFGRAARAAIPLLFLAGCDLPPPEPVPPNSISFGVFGDGPYYPGERARYARMLADVDAADIAWLLHVGDILQSPCSDAEFTGIRDGLNALTHPVIYTPGDNEWTDCHEKRAGEYDPLERLTSLRRIFFATPGRSLGASPIELETQGSDSSFAEFVENTRWTRGRVVFAAVHMVGSENALEAFRGRTAAHDSASALRTRAGLAWLDATFDRATADSARLVVLAMHANIGLDATDKLRRGYESFVRRLSERVAGFPGAVVLIHGDSHTQRFDQPLRDSAGRVQANLARLETFGSPDIGWLHVVVDTVAGQVLRVVPRLM